MTTIAKSRKSADERKHDYYLSLAILLRQGRLVRMPAGVKRASFELDGQHVDVYASSTYAGFGYVVRYGEQGYECGCKSFEFRYSCEHTKNANRRGIARYHAQPLPVAVRDTGGYTAHLDLGDHREVVRAGDLPYLFPGGYRLIEKDDPEWDQWMTCLSQLDDRTSGGVADDAWRAQVRTSLSPASVATIPDDDMAAHIEDSIRSGEFADPTSCRYCGARCKGGVCMDCLSIAA